MFFSEQILINRKSGVATVWLVATLGSKSGFKKVTRKDILDVDVPKACDTIQNPGAPMALRLQGNLMYGVTRVYSQQCEYVLSDVQSVRDRMKTMLRAIQNAAIDPDAGKARRDQLVLPDDPNLDIDLAFQNINLDNLFTPEPSSTPSQNSSLLTPLSVPHTQLSGRAKALIRLDFESPDGIGSEGGFGFTEVGSSVHRSDYFDHLPEVGEDAFFEDPGFTIDEDGDLHLTSPLQGRCPPGNDINEFEIERRVQEEHEQGEGIVLNQPADAMDIDNFQPSAGKHRDLNADADAQVDQQLISSIRGLQKSSVPSSESGSSEAVQVPQRPRKIKVIQMDQQQQILNGELNRMNKEYSRNMGHVAAQKSMQKIAIQAKKNAFYWVWKIGIGGVGRGVGIEQVRHPLHMYSGDELIAALFGDDGSEGATKRKMSPGSSGSERARKRTRSEEEEEIGRGDEEGQFMDNHSQIPMDDGIEVGRDAASALADVSSQFPWNVSASVQGSRHGSSIRGKTLGSVGGFPSSVGMPSSQLGVDLGRPGSRFTSASPLAGRGPVLERLSDVDFREDNNIDNDGDLLGEQNQSSSFDLHRLRAAVDTQTTAQSQWVKAMLDQESLNFLQYLRGEAARKSDGESKFGSVTFEEFLPPGRHSKVVAAQAFHHVLTLASKELIVVSQKQDYGEIQVDVAVDV